jgi:hypothetical protein
MFDTAARAEKATGNFFAALVGVSLSDFQVTGGDTGRVPQFGKGLPGLLP